MTGASGKGIAACSIVYILERSKPGSMWKREAEYSGYEKDETNGRTSMAETCSSSVSAESVLTRNELPIAGIVLDIKHGRTAESDVEHVVSSNIFALVSQWQTVTRSPRLKRSFLLFTEDLRVPPAWEAFMLRDVVSWASCQGDSDERSSSVEE